MMLLQGHLEFEADFSPGVTVLPVGTAEHGVVYLGDHHRWQATFYPSGVPENDGEFVSLFIENLTKSKNSKAILVEDETPSPCCAAANKIEADPVVLGKTWGWRNLVSISSLRQERRRFKVVCLVVVVVVSSQNKEPPRSFPGGGAPDVTFLVEDKTFTAHRRLLAARSTVFHSMLTGSTAHTGTPTPTIRLDDMSSWTFGALRYFIYTDELPGADEFGDEPPGDVEFVHEIPQEFKFGESMMQRLLDLLAAADRFALDELKLMCADKVCDDISVETASEMLVYAEMYSCPELKERCLSFLVIGDNFRNAVLTNWYVWLLRKCPSILKDIRYMFYGEEDTV